MHGLPGSGKSCAQLLLLNEDPPHDNVTNSTPIVHPPVRATRSATRVSVDDKKWERVTRQELLHRLAFHLNDTAVKRTDDDFSNKTWLEQSQVSNHSGEASIISKLSGQASNATNDDPSNVINDPSNVINDPSNVINEILHTPGLKGFKRNEEWLYIIDSGGQPAYQELFPLFTRAASLNIITIDLSKPLDEEIELMYRIGGKSYPCHSKSTQLTSFQSVVSSGSIYRPLNIPCIIKKQHSRSMHLVLGTHYDKVNKSTFEEHNNTLMESMKVLGPYLYDCVIKKSDDSVIFPVNTLAKGEERTKHSQEICKAIYTRGSDASLTIEIPIRWFAFELSLPNYSRIITLEKALDIGEKCKMDEEDTKLALNYLHDVTLILYYPEVLDGVIFTDPQPILEFISQLLALTYIDDNEALQEITAEGKKLSQKEDINKIKDGYFKEELFHKLNSSEMFDSKFSSSDLLKLLLYLNIIAEVQEKNEYFIPCALPSYSTINLSLPQENVNHSKPLRILYWNKTDDQILPIPQGIFPQTIVRLLNQTNYKVTVPSRNELKYYKYRDAMSLRIEINSPELIHIINNFTYIEVYYTGPMKDCSIVHKLVMKAVRDSSTAINVEHAGYLYSAIGSQNKGSCIVTDEKNLKTICPESSSDKCTIDNRYSCWFDTNSG